jgi:hypothetical protein
MKKLLLILAVFSASAHAEFYTGNDLYNKQTSTSTIDQMVGLGYVVGVFDTSKGITHCGPPNVTAGQIDDMVKNYLASNPAIRHLPADLLVQGTLAQAWKCQDKKKGSSL